MSLCLVLLSFPVLTHLFIYFFVLVGDSCLLVNATHFVTMALLTHLWKLKRRRNMGIVPKLNQSLALELICKTVEQSWL